MRARNRTLDPARGDLWRLCDGRRWRVLDIYLRSIRVWETPARVARGSKSKRILEKTWARETARATPLRDGRKGE